VKSEKGFCLGEKGLKGRVLRDGSLKKGPERWVMREGSRGNGETNLEERLLREGP